MKIIIAPNTFKGSLPADEVAAHISAGIKRALPSAQIVELPIADGGDGTLDLIINAAGGTFIEQDVTGPLGETFRAAYGILPDGATAVVEMAAASGLRLVPPDRLDPMRATTYGTGELIRAALDRGCQRVIVGVGGSATVDGGIGMAQALGARLLDADGNDIPFGGGGLGAIKRIDLAGLHPRVRDAEIIVACDVENPLVGPEGAAPIFGPQKGASPEMVETLAAYLENYARIVARDTGHQIADLPGAGAAGGLAGGLVAFLSAKIESGARVLLDLMGMDAHLQDADLVITGEGRIDGQTAYGKGPAAVAKLAKKHNLPVIGIAGCLADDAAVVYAHGIDGLISTVCCPMSLDEAMQSAAPLVEAAAERAIRLVMIGMGSNG
jgi:glycerate 2-kinase